MVSEVLQMNSKVPFVAKNVWAYRKAIEEENVAIDITVDEPQSHWPVKKGLKYKLKVDEGCGLVFKDEHDQHVHLGQMGPARAIEQCGGHLHCSDEVNGIINSYLLERRIQIEEMEKARDLDLDEMFEQFTQEKKFEEGDKVTFLPFYFEDDDEGYRRPGGLFSIFMSDEDEDDEDFEKNTMFYYRKPEFYARFIRDIEQPHANYNNNDFAEIMFKNHKGKIVVESVDRRYLQKWKSKNEP